MNRWIFILILAQATIMVACVREEPNYTPKPKGYFRIDLPEPAYKDLDTNLPFQCHYSKYAHLEIEAKEEGKFWVNVNYPSFNATFNITYFPLHDDLRALVLSEEKMINFHVEHGKADNVEYYFIEDPKQKIYGRMYDIMGIGVACPLQFWITDSTRNYLRASLYFNFAPNNDSLQPVIQYLKEDALMMINTLSWKK